MFPKLTLPVLAILAAPFCFSSLATASTTEESISIVEHVGDNCMSLAIASKDKKTFPCERVYETLSASQQTLNFKFVGKDNSITWVTAPEPSVLNDDSKSYRVTEVVAEKKTANANGIIEIRTVRTQGKSGDLCVVTPTINSVLAQQQGDTKPMPRVACSFRDQWSQVVSGIFFMSTDFTKR